jgi:hypothetical protein
MIFPSSLTGRSGKNPRILSIGHFYDLNSATICAWRAVTGPAGVASGGENLNPVAMAGGFDRG